MNVHKLKPDTEYIAIKPAIVTLKERIANGVADLNDHQAKGRLTSFKMAQDMLNKQVDEYISMRKLKLV